MTVRSRHFSLRALFAGLALALVASSSVMAADFGVVPLKVLLSPKKATEVLTIHNNASTPLQLQVEGKAWSQDANKQWVLKDTDDLIFSPEILTVAPGGEANLRIGTLEQPDETELSYRVLLTEIRDSTQATTQGLSLNVRTQVSLPIFVDPPGAAAKPALVSAERRQNTLRLDVSNSGNARIDAQGMNLELLDSTGKVIETDPATSSYALAGASMFVDIPVKPASCKVATTVRLTLTDPVVTLTHDFPVTAQQCGNGSL